MKKQVVAHLKSDIKNFKKEAAEDKKLIKKIIKPKKKAAKSKPKSAKKGHEKFEKVMHEYKEGKLRSGSKKGPKVRKLSQARAIGYSESRRADHTAKNGK